MSCEGIRFLWETQNNLPHTPQIKVPSQYQSQAAVCGMRAVAPAEERQKKQMGRDESSGTAHVKTRTVSWRIKPGWEFNAKH